MKTLARPRRLPPNYQLVYDVVRAQRPGIHAPAADIHAQAKARKPRLGYSTVYRALDRLLRLGLVLQVHIPGMNAAVYEPARANHAHFVCRTCGALEDIDCDWPDRAMADAMAARQGEVDEITVTVLGRCAACLAEGPGRPAARGD